MEPCFSKDLLDREACMFGNLRLLGFNERKHGLALVPGLFTRSNPSAGDKIFYFLFSLLRPNQYEEDFLGLWPHFKKAEASAYRKVVHGFVYELENIGAIPKSHSSRSTLANCTGDRFVKLLFHLSSHALEVAYGSLPSGSIPSNDLKTPAKDFQHDEDVLMMTHKLMTRQFLEMNIEDARKQTLWRTLSNDIAEEYRLLVEEEEALELQLEKLSATSPLSLNKLQEIERLLESNMEYTDLCRTLASGAASDVIKEGAHRFTVRGDKVRVCNKVTLSDADAIASPALVNTRDKRRVNEEKSSKGTPKTRTVISPAKQDQMEDGGSDDVLSWGKMFHNLRSSIDSPMALSYNNRMRTEIDLVDVVKGLTEALQHVVKPATSLRAISEGSFGDYLQRTYGGPTAIHVHSQNLEPMYAFYKQHLVDAQELRRKFRTDLNEAEESIEALYAQIENRKDDRSSNAGEAEMTSLSPSLNVLGLTLVPPTPAEKPLDSMDAPRSLCAESVGGQTGERKQNKLQFVQWRASPGRSENVADGLLPMIVWEEDPEEFSASLVSMRETVGMEALKSNSPYQPPQMDEDDLHMKETTLSSNSIYATTPEVLTTHFTKSSSRRDSIPLLKGTPDWDLLAFDAERDSEELDRMSGS